MIPTIYILKKAKLWRQKDQWLPGDYMEGGREEWTGGAQGNFRVVKSFCIVW